ncbi:MAG: alpha-glucan family phosphorylase [Myxococcota bacterium]
MADGVAKRVAYFSMEVALEAGIPGYSGGLGVLAGDTLRSAADLGLPLVGVTLLHRKGYFRQSLDARGRQRERAERWRPLDRLVRLPARARIPLEGRSVALRAWRYEIRGARGDVVPVYLLDTDLRENTAVDRRLTDALYGGDDRTRLRQEAVLGLGGVAMLRALGVGSLDHYHLNEGHAALVALALFDELGGVGPHGVNGPRERVAAVRARCVFTTHTPVPAGHDRFPIELVDEVVGPACRESLAAFGLDPTEAGELDLTDLALRASDFVNGVAMRHAEVSRTMFPGHAIRSITNGVHPGTWAAPEMAALFDACLPDWRTDPFLLRHAVSIPPARIAKAHRAAKTSLLAHVAAATDRTLDADVLTLGFARRATAYKRATLLFHDLDRLVAAAERSGPIQLVFAGKAHPRDVEGKRLIEAVFRAARGLRGRIEVVYLEGYDMRLGALLTAGCDVWLNTPIPPLEASGTSGMKAALNGVPSLSILDGWWIEGWVEGVTGWSIGHDGDADDLPEGERDAHHADQLYRKLEDAVTPTYYEDPESFQRIMQSCIALNGSCFNTHRMLLQYVHEAYRAPPSAQAGPRSADADAILAPRRRAGRGGLEASSASEGAG